MKVLLCDVDEIPDAGTRKLDFFGREVLVLKEAGTPKAVSNYFWAARCGSKAASSFASGTARSSHAVTGDA
jgi:nitrite reductase/ring-hydroxylating ferredoxin subunit